LEEKCFEPLAWAIVAGDDIEGRILVDKGAGFNPTVDVEAVTVDDMV
jgi:hypothetical protein